MSFSLNMPPETSIFNGLYLVLHGYGPIQIEQLSYVSVVEDKSFKLWRKATVYFHSGQDFGLAFTRVSIFGLVYWFTDDFFKGFKPHSATAASTTTFGLSLSKVYLFTRNVFNYFASTSQFTSLMTRTIQRCLLDLKFTNIHYTTYLGSKASNSNLGRL